MTKELQGNMLYQVNWINKKFLHHLLSQKCKPMMSDRETYCEIVSEDLKKLPEDQKLPKLCFEARLNLVEVGQLFFALPSPNGAKNQSLCREYTLPRDEKENCAKGRIQSDARFGPVSDIKSFASHTEDTALKLKFHLCSKIKPSLGLKL